MKLSYLYATLIIIFSLVMFFSINHVPAKQKQHSDLIQENKIRLSNLRQLTFSRENAEAYFSNNGDKLIFQGHDGDSLCDQIYIMNIKTSSINMVSIGEGVTTCSYFVYPDCKKQFMHLLIWETKNVQKNRLQQRLRTEALSWL